MEREIRNIRVDAKKFAAAALFRSKEETRYYLNGVYIEPHPDGGVIMVATNGHQMAVIRDENGEANAPFICKASQRFYTACAKSPADVLKRPGQIHFVGHVANLVCEGFDGDPSVIGDCHIEVEYAPDIDGIYPDWRRVLPPFDAQPALPGTVGPYFGVNAEYVADFAKAMKIITGMREQKFITMNVNDRASPIGITNQYCPEFLGVLMPAREASERPTLPAWLKEQKKEAAE